MHAVLLVTFVAVPARQSVQVDAPYWSGGVKVPTEQRAHTVWPDCAWLDPGGHDWQLIVPLVGVNVPARHGEHWARPDDEEKVPNWQATQVDVPDAGWEEPGAHP
ncbi:MAG: hypothetical protein P4L83_09635 [Nevskia sp.]|nr:hypothetical protein [Nevskia sp.]